MQMRELRRLADDARQRLAMILATPGGREDVTICASSTAGAYVSAHAVGGFHRVERINDDNVPAAIERLLAKAAASRQPTEAEIYATLGVEMRDRREMGRDAA